VPKIGPDKSELGPGQRQRLALGGIILVETIQMTLN
jgi:hypothetical protein